MRTMWTFVVSATVIAVFAVTCGWAGDIHKRHRTDLAAELSEMPSARLGGADVVAYLRKTYAHMPVP